MPDPTLDQQRRLVKYYVASLKKHPSWPKIISEGDSWFSFPPQIHPSVIDVLDRGANRRLRLLRLEKNGDKALRIVGGKQKKFLGKILRKHGAEALLFSGGGNDTVGDDLDGLLRKKTPTMTWEACIHKEAVKDRIMALRGAYRDIVRLRNDNSPNCRIYFHSYDYAVPDGRGARLWGIKFGPWMKDDLEDKGIRDPDDQKQIIRWILDRFDEMVQDVVKKSSNVVYVETLNTLTHPEDWNDELHPSRGGFRKIAQKFRDKLKDQFPATFGD